MTPNLKLLISDIDGTLVTPDKSLTPRSIAAVQRLGEAGVAFSLISSRSARGMAHVVEQLRVQGPIAAFNGGNIVGPDRRLISALRLSAKAAQTTLALLAERGVDAWVFADDGWFLANPNGSKVAREQHAVGFGPTVVANFDAVIDRIDKLVGVSDDYDLLARVEAETQAALGNTAIAVRSQSYYLDVTNPDANKGHGVLALCAAMGVDPAHAAVIGDMSNDVAMFRVAGFSIAMGQAPDTVKAEADAVTTANTEDGFASAVERLILPRVER